MRRLVCAVGVAIVGALSGCGGETAVQTVGLSTAG